MHEPRDHDDDILAEPLLRELGALLARADPVPGPVLEAARLALGWRTVDAELAALVADSLGAEGDLALVRSQGTPRLLSFEGPGLAIELEVIADDRRRRLIGQLLPASGGRVQIEHAGGVVAVEADERGRFGAGELLPGPLRLRVTPAGRELTVHTEWTPV